MANYGRNDWRLIGETGTKYRKMKTFLEQFYWHRRVEDVYSVNDDEQRMRCANET
jgi:hypothetical protein